MSHRTACSILTLLCNFTG